MRTNAGKGLTGPDHQKGKMVMLDLITPKPFGWSRPKISGCHDKHETKGGISVRIKLTLISSLVALVAAALFAVSAQADVRVSTPLFGNSVFGTTVTDSSSATMKGSATLNGKLEVKAIMPHGLPKSQRKHCEWNDFAWSDWETSSGGKVWAPAGHHGWTHACLVHGVWRQIGGGPGQWNCGNVVKPIGAPLPPHAVKVKMSEIVVVKEFVYTATVNVKAEVKQEASATATCALPGVTAASTVHASGLAEANASGSAKATSKSQALVKATSEAVKVAGEKQVSLVGSAQADATLKLEGSASAFCSSQQVPPEVCTPPLVGTPPNCNERPSVFNIQLLQEAIVSRPDHPTENVICADISAPNGDKLSITFIAEFGQFAHKVFANSKYGPGGYCDTYLSPTEVPPGEYDLVWVFVKDETTGLTSMTPEEGGAFQFEHIVPEEPFV